MKKTSVIRIPKTFIDEDWFDKEDRVKQMLWKAYEEVRCHDLYEIKVIMEQIIVEAES